MATSSSLIFGSLGPFSVPPNPLALSGSTLVDPLNADSPFSLGIIADISHSDKGLITSFNGNLTPVPEPMSLSLGCGLIAVIGVGRKFRK